MSSYYRNEKKKREVVGDSPELDKELSASLLKNISLSTLMKKKAINTVQVTVPSSI